MSFLSPSFFAFLACSLGVYSLAPKRLRWIPLLASGLLFYACGGPAALLFPAVTALAVWLAALGMEAIDRGSRERMRAGPALSREEKKAEKARARGRKRLLLWAAFALSLGVWLFFKFRGPLLRLAGLPPERADGLLIPLGISFYTLGALGYLLDVYGGRISAEPHFGRFLLYVTFFPQVIQGPIPRYGDLGAQLRDSPDPSAEGIRLGLLRMLWGCFKKLVVADRLAPVVSAVFGFPDYYGGAAVFAAVALYGLQLYADFSGGIDIALGAAELFGIRLQENFRRPYFAVSLADFWRRWHITLGSWMRDYVFYPLVLSKPLMGLQKALRRRGAGWLAAALPAAAGNIAVFLLVGLWHGSSWRFVAWGLFNGVVLAAGELLEPAYRRFREGFPRLAASFGFRVFRILRTYFVICVGYYFDCCSGVGQALSQMRKLIDWPAAEELRIRTLEELLEHQLGYGRWDTRMAVTGVASGLALMLAASVAAERGIDVRRRILGLRTPLRWACLYLFLLQLATFAFTGRSALSGFMYAAF